MPKYNFREICAVPKAESFVDVMLSRTNRRTPTVVRSKWKISSIRQFYMRKVRFTQQNMVDRLSKILDEFPRLDSLHPFYADLINVLYDRDHYKLALGQVNIARQIIQNIGKDYIKLLKYGDSVYRCKALKRAALGRMAKIIRGQKASFAYLEQVRQHLSRLPSIDPHERTLILTGFPNAGKSSFMNKITNADVEVQNYPFTTKALYVGHCDYEYLRWQVIDSPGILDRPLEERNTIEMQAITALAHLNACVIFFVDLSPLCRYSIETQVKLFFSLLPLYNNKPVCVVLNKIDLRPFDQLDEDEKRCLSKLDELSNVKVMPMSNVEDKNVMAVRNGSCHMLLEHRIEIKAKNGKLNSKVLEDRLFIAQPIKRDSKQRDIVIPDSVKNKWLLKKKGVNESSDSSSKDKLLADIESEKGGPGVYWFDTREHWQLDKPEWKYDPIPEFYNGKNVSDFYYPGIAEDLAKLEEEEAENVRQDRMRELEKDQELRNAVEAGKVKDPSGYGSDLGDDDEMLYKYIKRKIRLAKDEGSRRKSVRNSRSLLTRPDRKIDIETMTEQLDDLGINTGRLSRRVKFEREKMKKKRRNMEDMKRAKQGGELQSIARGVSAEGRAAGLRSLSRSQRKRSRSRSRTHTPSRGISSVRDSWTAHKLKEKAVQSIQRSGRRHESDRAIADSRPKHLFVPRKSQYKGDWR